MRVTSRLRTRTFGDLTVSCAPATGALTLTKGTTTAKASRTGKTCSWTKSGTTKYGFAGHDKATYVVALLTEKGTTVRGLALRLRRHRWLTEAERRLGRSASRRARRL